MSFIKSDAFTKLEESMWEFCREHGVLPSMIELVTNDVEMTAHFKIKESFINDTEKRLKLIADRLSAEEQA